MRLLVDTHVALWSMLDDTRLTNRAHEMLGESDLVVSVVSFWEVAIKQGLTRHATTFSISAETMLDKVAASRAEILQVSAKHALRVACLPAQHGDPFDRLLVAQALSEQLILVTHDKQVAAYSDTFLLV